MSKAWTNTARGCFVKDGAIDAPFKQMIYPLLAESDNAHNDAYCAVKELYYKFASDQVLNRVASRLYPTAQDDLTLRFSTALEEYNAKVTQAKQELVDTLRLATSQVAEELDRVVDFSLGRLSSTNGALKRRVEDNVFAYNKKAEQTRKTELEALIQQYFRTASVIPTAPAVEARAVVVEEADAEIPNVRVQVRPRKRAEPIEYRGGAMQFNDSSTKDQPVEGTGADDEIDEFISDERFDEIKKKVRLSNPENLNIEGLAQHSSVNCIIKDCDPNYRFVFGTNQSLYGLKRSSDQVDQILDWSSYSSS